MQVNPTCQGAFSKHPGRAGRLSVCTRAQRQGTRDQLDPTWHWLHSGRKKIRSRNTAIICPSNTLKLRFFLPSESLSHRLHPIFSIVAKDPSPAQFHPHRVAMTSKPAWQRLGLKLKSTNGNSGIGVGQQPDADTQPVDRHSTSASTDSATKKRKLSDSQPASASDKKLSTTSHSQNASSIKKQRTGDDQKATDRPPSTLPAVKKKKSVTFGDTPTKNGYSKTLSNDITPPQTLDHQPTTQKGKTQSKSKGPTKKQKQQPAYDIKPALLYLRHWGSSRDSWKFNKNHQSALIKHAFDITNEGIPATDIDIFYQYISDLKGQTRTRLREMALAIRLKDQRDGVSAFPAGMKNASAKQEKYDSIIADYWTSPQVRKRKSFCETDFLDSSDDEDPIIKRVIKRLRAEMIIDELSDGEQTDVSTTSSKSSSSVTKGTSASARNSMDVDGGKKLKLNDGTGKRRRKLRTATEDSSDSDLSSDSDSDTSSSGSSSDDSDSEEDEPQGNGYGSDSSSSSSSSSEGEDDSGSESDDEDEL